MPFLITLFADWKVTAPWAKLLGWIVPGAVAALLLWGLWAAFAGHYEKQGEASNEGKHIVQHAAAVTDARTDERGAQASATAIGVAVATKNQLAREAQATTGETIRHALDTPIAPPAGAAQPPLPRLDELRIADALDAGVDRANRAAARPGS